MVSDTAGMHDTTDPVEQIGIRKAKEHIARADMILFMKTAGEEIDDLDLNAVQASHDKVILVFNKMDLIAPGVYTPVARASNQHSPCPDIRPQRHGNQRS